jgi:hypothetical protein
LKSFAPSFAKHQKRGRSSLEEVEGHAMPASAPPKQLLHLAFGGELNRLDRTKFKDLDRLDTMGIFLNYANAYAAWKAKAQHTIDNPEMRYFIVHLRRLLDPEVTTVGSAR